MNSQDSQSLRSVADLALLLSIGWDGPTEELAAGIRDGSYVADILSCLRELSAPEKLIDAVTASLSSSRDSCESTAALLDQLRTDRTMLFDVPGSHETSPYESQHRDQAEGQRDVPLFISKSAVQVKELFDDAALSTSPNEPPDHIAREFEFISYCADQETAGNQTPDSSSEKISATRPVTWSELRSTMGKDHLAQWVSPWSDTVIDQARTAFYRNLASATRALVEAEILWNGGRRSMLWGRLPLFTRSHR